VHPTATNDEDTSQPNPNIPTHIHTYPSHEGEIDRHAHLVTNQLSEEEPMTTKHQPESEAAITVESIANTTGSRSNLKLYYKFRGRLEICINVADFDADAKQSESTADALRMHLAQHQRL